MFWKFDTSCVFPMYSTSLEFAIFYGCFRVAYPLLKSLSNISWAWNQRVLYQKVSKMVFLSLQSRFIFLYLLVLNSIIDRIFKKLPERKGSIL